MNFRNTNIKKIAHKVLISVILTILIVNLSFFGFMVKNYAEIEYDISVTVPGKSAFTKRKYTLQQSSGQGNGTTQARK